MTAGIDEPLDVLVEVRPGPMAPGLLGRALGAVAARCDLPMDRLDDALLAVDALCDEAQRDERGLPLRVRVAGLVGELWLHVGPMAPERAQALLGEAGIPGGPGLLATLADGAHLAGEGDDDQVLALSFTARSG